MREHVSVIKTSFGFCLVFLGFRKKCFPTREEYSKFLLGVFFFFSPKREFKKKKISTCKQKVLVELSLLNVHCPIFWVSRCAFKWQPAVQQEEETVRGGAW